MIDSHKAAQIITLFCRLNTRARLNNSFSTGEIGLLLYLSNKETIHTSVEAASYFKVSKPAVSKVVASLEQKGLISKTRSASDARVIELQVSDKGKSALLSLLRAFEDIADNLRSKIGEEEFDRFIETMDKANSIIAEDL